MAEPTQEEIRETLIHWKKATLDRNLRELQVEILRIKLSNGSKGLIQMLQQEYDRMEKELDALQKKNQKNLHRQPIQPVHQGESELEVSTS